MSTRRYSGIGKLIAVAGALGLGAWFVKEVVDQDPVSFAGKVVREPDFIQTNSRGYNLDLEVEVSTNAYGYGCPHLDPKYHDGTNFNYVSLNLAVGPSIPEIRLGDIVRFELAEGFERTDYIKTTLGARGPNLYWINTMPARGKLLSVSRNESEVKDSTR